MCCVAILILTTVFAVTVGQVSIVTDKNNVQDGDSVVLTCTAPNFSDNIFIIQDITNRAFCFANTPCSTNTSLYNAVKSGTNIVTFTILSFLKERDEGIWKIKYAINTESTLELTGFKESPTVTTEMYSESSSLDQTSSSQKPSAETSKTQKTKTTSMSTTANVLTSTSLHFTSDYEVTTQILNSSNNSMEFSVGAVIATVISGIISVCLVLFLVCLYLRRKHTRKQTSEAPQPKSRRTNEKHNKEQHARKNFRGQTIPSTYPSDYFDSGNPVTKNLYKMSNYKQRHNYKLSQSMQNNDEDKIEINCPSSRNHQTRANTRGPCIPLAHFAPEYSKNYRRVPYMLYVDPHEPRAYMYQDNIVYPAYNRVHDRQSGQHYYS